MLKKLLVASAVLAMSSTMAFASAAPYVGASLGVVNSTANSSSFRGIPLTMNAGFGGVISQTVYLGGEVFGVAGTSVLNNHTNNGTSLRTTYGYGASFIPGLMLSDHTTALLRLGVIKSRFTSIRDTATGGQVGLGLQTSLTQNLDLRGEYDYTKYRRISGVSAKSDAFNLGVVYKFA